MSPLLSTQTPRTLEGKSKIFGFELSDVLVLFLNLSIQNLIFGTTHFKFVMVWGTTLTLAAILFFVKRGKPDKYLQHLGQYIASPTVRYANLNDRHYQKFSRSRGGKNE
jgi:hypothetical protein